jgi:hypothetical protein
MTSLPRRAAFWLIVFAIVGTLSAGCGRETYLTRLNETSRYFAYEDRLNQNLTRVAWRGQSFLLRVPKQFQPINGKPNAEGDDPRQPAFVDLDLPGLQGAWQASLPLTGGEGSGPAWLYLCCNVEMLGKKGDEDKAATFNRDVIVKTATALGQQKQIPNIEKMPIYEVPPKKEEAFVDRLKYTVINPGIPVMIEEKAYRVRIFCFKKDKSPAQFTLLFVLPDNAVQAGKLDHAIDMSLATLQVTQDKPVPAPAQGSKSKAAGKSKSF